MDKQIINYSKVQEEQWSAELMILLDVMNGVIGTNQQRNTLRRIIRQHAESLRIADPNNVDKALRSIVATAKVRNAVTLKSRPIKLGQFIET